MRRLSVLGFAASLAASLAVALTSAPAEAAKYALVVGIDDYKNIDKLEKAKADARAYAALLRDKGFVVDERYDPSSAELNDDVAEFVEKVKPGDTAVFVYSGHGWSDGSQNFIVGADVPARLPKEKLVKRSMPIRNGFDGVLDDLERKGATLKIAVIDACRDNPFQAPPGERGYGLSRGLARVEAQAGTFVVFSAGEGQAALDRLSQSDADPNSVFARVFLPLLRDDASLLEAVKAAQERVHGLAHEAGKEQDPAYYDQVRGQVCLSGTCKTAVVAADPMLAGLVESAASRDVLIEIAAHLPDGPLKLRALARAEALKGKAVAKADAHPDVVTPRNDEPKSFETPAIPVGAKLEPRTGHFAAIQAIAYSPDGTRLMSADAVGILKLWDTAGGKLLRTTAGHVGRVRGVAVSPDGGFFVTTGEDKTVKTWDASNGAPLLTIDGFENPAQIAIVTPDSKVVAVDDGTAIEFRNAADGTRRFGRIEGRTLASSAPFSPDGRTFVLAVQAEHSLEIWDGISGKSTRTLTGCPDTMASAAIASSGGRVAATCGNALLVWDSTRAASPRKLIGHKASVHSVVFSSDGRRLASSSRDGTVKVWDPENGRLLRDVPAQTSGVGRLAYSRDGRTIAAVGVDDTIKLWNAADGKPLASLPANGGQVNAIAFSPDGNVFAAGNEGSEVTLWNVREGKVMPSLGSRATVAAFAAFAADGLRFLSIGEEGVLRAWDTQAGTAKPASGDVGRGITSFALSADRASVAVGGEDGAVTVRNERGDVRKIPVGQVRDVDALALSPDGRTVAAGGADGRVKLFDSSTGASRLAFAAGSGVILSVQFTLDGRFLVIVGAIGVELLDASTGRRIRAFNEPGASWSALSPNNREVYLGGSNGVRLRHLDEAAETEAVVAAFSSDATLNGAVSPDGRTLVTVNADHALNFWNVADQRLRTTVPAHKADVATLSFSPDGKRLVTGSWDKTTKLWNVETGDLIATYFIFEGKGVAFTPEGKYVCDCDASEAFELTKDGEPLPLQDFIARGHRERLFDAAAAGK